MDHYEEESLGTERVYSGEVLKLIFRYVFVYKKYLFLSLFFVLFITGANLSVPYLFKIIIDRYIFKQGQIVHLDAYSSRAPNNLYDKQFRRGKYLSGTTRFLFQSRLKYFSSEEKDGLINSGVLSGKKYVFIESRRLRCACTASTRTASFRNLPFDQGNRRRWIYAQDRNGCMRMDR